MIVPWYSQPIKKVSEVMHHNVYISISYFELSETNIVGKLETLKINAIDKF